MPRHYSYRLDHDLGFAPHIWRNVATVCGCKSTTVEKWAEAGSWVVGIGGKGTGQADKLIYALKVTETPTYREFCDEHPANAAYLNGCPILKDEKVLMSRGHFYYFGSKARVLPNELAHIIHPVQGCKRLSEEDIVRLERYLRRLKPGKHAEPSNPQPRSSC